MISPTGRPTRPPDPPPADPDIANRPATFGDLPRPAVAANHDGTTRLPDGQLAVLVLAHLRAHPDADFSPYELAKMLRRSHGSIRTRLLALTASGQVMRTRTRPARFQLHP